MIGLFTNGQSFSDPAHHYDQIYSGRVEEFQRQLSVREGGEDGQCFQFKSVDSKDGC